MDQEIKMFKTRWIKRLEVFGIVVVVSGVNLGFIAYTSSVYQSQIGTLEATVLELQESIAYEEFFTNLSMTESVVSVSDLASKVIPSVVGIEVSAQVTLNYGPFGSRTTTQSGSGSGIVYSADGYIITNYHVIEAFVVNRTGGSINVITSDGISYSASVVGSDPESDLAVLKVDATALIPADLDLGTGLRVGDFAMAVGYPLGMDLASSVTVGVISGIDRNISSDVNSEGLIQTDASINPGNSGGALVDAQGQVIGITNAKIATTTVEGIGFAIPIDYALPIIESLINSSK
jgi:serine protease Do